LVLEPGLADSLIAAALGDKKSKADAPAPGAPKADAKRDLTMVERNVLKRLLSIFTDAMQAAWAPVLPFKPEVVRFETDPRLATSSPTSESAVLCSFELEGSLRGVIQLALPYTAIEPAKKALMSPPKIGKAGDESFATALRDELTQVEVRLSALLGKTRMTVRQLLELEPGDLVMTGTSEGASLPLYVQGKAKFTGQPKVVGGAVALELETGPRQDLRRPFEIDTTEPTSKAA
jgi:flagellar motor switch protein FliM